MSNASIWYCVEKSMCLSLSSKSFARSMNNRVKRLLTLVFLKVIRFWILFDKFSTSNFKLAGVLRNELCNELSRKASMSVAMSILFYLV